MVKNAPQLSDEDFAYGYLPEYLDDLLPSDQRSRFESYLKSKQKANVPTDFGICRGQLQIALQKLYLDESKLHDLHSLVEDDAARANHEAHDIEEAGRSEILGNSFRLFVFVAFLACLAGVGYYFLAPEKKAAFAPLETLTYEAIVMIEEPEERLDFPTDNIRELQDYFARYPDLGFRSRPLHSPGNEWRLIGGSVIDYEVAKIIAVHFVERQQGTPLLFFIFEGTMKDLPYAEPGNQDGLLYQAYATDRLNIVGWQVSDGVMGLVLGTQGGSELAKIAKTATGFQKL